MRRRSGDLGRPVYRHLGVEELHFRPGHEHLAQLPLARLEHLADDVPLVGAEIGTRGHQVEKLFGGHGVAPGPGITAEHPHHQVHRPGQEPYERPERRRDPVEHRGCRQRDGLGSLQRQPFGGKLTKHQREVGDNDGHRDEREGGREAGGHATAAQQPPEFGGEGRGTERAGKQRRRGDPDLHGRQEAVRVLRQPGGALAAFAPLLERAHLALTQRHERHLRRGEESAEEHEGEHDGDIAADVAHGSIPGGLAPECMVSAQSKRSYRQGAGSGAPQTINVWTL